MDQTCGAGISAILRNRTPLLLISSLSAALAKTSLGSVSIDEKLEDHNLKQWVAGVAKILETVKQIAPDRLKDFNFGVTPIEYLQILDAVGSSCPR